MYISDYAIDGPSEVDKLTNTKELLKYLIRKFPLPHNMMTWQGLFTSCKIITLSEICCEYAKSNENEEIMYFSKNIPMKGKRLFLFFPNQFEFSSENYFHYMLSMFLNCHVNKLLQFYSLRYPMHNKG